MQNLQVGADVGAKIKWSLAVVLGLAVGLVAPGTVPHAAADCAFVQERYPDFEVQIDEVLTHDAYDCLVVQNEVRGDTWDGHIIHVVDVANACGEDFLVVAEEGVMPGELVADGELKTIATQVERQTSHATFRGQHAFLVLPNSDLNDDVQLTDYDELTRIKYSYTGASAVDESDGGCEGDVVFFGCATAPGPEAPANGPLTWVMVGLGLVWVGRRVRR